MSRKKIQSRIDDLEPAQSDDDAEQMVIAMTSIREPGMENVTVADSPHPELTIRQYQGMEAETLAIATPNVIPEPYCNESILSVCSCKNENGHDADWMNDEQRPTYACELWDALDDKQLIEERQIRERNGEPIPEVLAQYE